MNTDSMKSNFVESGFTKGQAISLVDALAQVRSDHDMNVRLYTELSSVKRTAGELKVEIGAELREIHGEVAALSRSVSSTKSDVGFLKDSVESFRNDMSSQRSDWSSLKMDVKRGFVDLKREFLTLKHELRQDMHERVMEQYKRHNSIVTWVSWVLPASMVVGVLFGVLVANF